MSKTLNVKITFTGNLKDDLIDYTDSNYIKLIADQKFISNYIFILSSKLFSYQSKL